MHTIVCGLTFGDEGKGSVTDFFVRSSSAKTIVRYNGGPQAGHNVVTEDGRWHCFAQLGAGSFVSGTRSVLAPEMLVELENLEVEAGVLEKKGVDDPLSRVVIDPACAVITPMHKMICQMKEVALGAARKGSCGMGVGEAARDRRVTAGALGIESLESLAQEKLAQASELLQQHPSDEMRALFDYFRGRCRPSTLYERYRTILARVQIEDAASSIEKNSVFEGAQGALLDRRRGFSPYVTESRSTYHHAASLIGRARYKKIGVMRAYAHRHGPGPFVTEDPRLMRRFADPYNAENRWQGPFRVGRLDLLALRYGVALNDGVDQLAVTGLDKLSGLSTIRACTAYSYAGDPAELEKLFLFERTGRKKARIFGFRDNAAADDGVLARVLFQCRPAEWIELPGWSRDLRSARTLKELPREAHRFLELLASERGLGVPIGLVSVGPSAADKIAVQ